MSNDIARVTPLAPPARGRAATHIRAPSTRSPTLSRVLSRDVILKLECLQPSGSFKLRGVAHAMARAISRDGVTSFVSSSGGNAGLACAYAAEALGVSAEVFVPLTTPERTREMLRAFGASVVATGEKWIDAHEKATERCAEASDGEKRALIHPFEGEDLWLGHSTMIDELAEDFAKDNVGEPAAIVLSVGGGGLLAGVLLGVERAGWMKTRVVAVETIGAACLYESVRARTVVTLKEITSVAKSLGASSPSRVVFDKVMALGDARVASRVCEDADAVRACVRFADDHRLLVEPACGAALAACYFPELRLLEGLEGDGPIVVIVCGGAVVDRKSLDELERRALA